MPTSHSFWENSLYRFLSLVRPYHCRIMTVPYGSISQAGPLYDKIYSREIDGAIISSFISPDEIRHFKRQLASYTPRVTFKTGFGYTIGQTISNSEKNDYFSKTSELVNDMSNLLPFDFNARLQDLLGKLSSCGKAETASLSREQIFCPATFRIMYPHQGALSIHSEKMINRIRPLNQELLSGITAGLEEVSYFVIMQNTESGGDLILFDRYCEDDDYDISQGLPTWKTVYKRRVRIIRIQEGDLILFNGGRIWHRISDIRGDSPRITLAGFTDFNSTQDTILYWS